MKAVNMIKEKSKPRAFPIRRLLIAAVLLIGLICVAALIRSIIAIIEPAFYHSKDIPGPIYELTGDSYLSQWQKFQDDIDTVDEINWTDNVGKVSYRFGQDMFSHLWAQITFVYYDRIDFAQRLYDQDAFGYYPWEEETYTPLPINSLSTPDFKAGCITVGLGTDERPVCLFVAKYGSCELRADSSVIEPYVSFDDYISLIEDYIDPQMAAWDVCYPDRLKG
jgi:hypothetical protein